MSPLTPAARPLQIAGYTALRCLHAGKTVVWRCTRDADNSPVVAKVVDIHSPPAEHWRLKHEYNLLKVLDKSGDSAVVRPVELIERSATTVLVLHDIGAADLLQATKAGPVDPDQAMDLAIGVAQALVHVHEARIVHRDVAPGNIVVNRHSGMVQLIDFGIASGLEREWRAAEGTAALEGTVPYMAPEQTGRMNRVTDLRSDLYGLGAVLYELLSGRPPFVEADLLSLVHAIIARPAVPLRDRVPALPRALCEIVDKLLAKSADDRYQSAQGLLEDLRICKEWETASANFELGRFDRSERLCLPQRLYGRARELRDLSDDLQVALTGKRLLTLVHGPSGVGKSVLVGELRPQVGAARGTLLSGKFDSLRRDLPFHAFCDAVAGFVREVQGEEPATADRWRSVLHEALGDIGQSLADIVPSIADVAGPFEPLEELSAGDTMRRLMAALVRFIGVVCRERPLLLFLDDLQWADALTFNLLDALLAHQETCAGLLILATQRSDEATGAAVESIARLCQRFAPRQVHLQPLTAADVAELVHDTVPGAEAVAAQVHQKTDGNPFFVRQFLTRIWDDALLRFDPHSSKWICDAERVETMAVTSNVAAMLAARLSGLPTTAQSVLQFAACLGDVFSIDTLCASMGESLEVVAANLWPALVANLIICLDPLHLHGNPQRPGLRYRFAHDRVRAVAHASIIDAAQLHARIGRALLAAQPQPTGSALFDVVDHLNSGRAHLDARTMLGPLAQLNMQAGLQAKRSAAFEPAMRYLRYALSAETLADATKFELEQELADCEYLAGEFDTAAARLTTLERSCRDPLGRARLHLRQARTLSVTGKTRDACDTARIGLRCLGLQIAAKPSMLTLGALLLRVRRLMGDKTPQQIADAAAVIDLRAVTEDELLQVLAIGAHGSGHDELFATASMHILCNTLTQGFTQGSAFACSVGGMVLTSGLGDLHRGRILGEAAEAMLAHRGGTYPATTRLAVNVIKNHLDEPPDALADRDIQISQTAAMQGDFEGLNSASAFTASLHFALSLPYCMEFCERRRTLLAPGSEGMISLQLYEQHVRCLRGETRSPTSLDTASFSEAVDCAKLLPVPRHIYFAIKIEIGLRHRDFDMVLAFLQRESEHWMMGNLAKTALGPVTALHVVLGQTQEALHAGRKTFWMARRVRWGVKLLAWFAQHGPRIYTGIYLLAQAEVAAVRGHVAEALRLYEAALPGVVQSGSLSHEVLALECAGRFHLATPGLRDSGVRLLRRARDAYTRWGATYKAGCLEAEFPELRQVEEASTPSAPESLRLRSSTQNSDALDWTAILRATQAMSSEFLLDNLLARLMEAVMSLGGADYGVMLLRQVDTWVVRASSVDADPAVGRPLNDAAVAPQRVVRFVEHAQEAVILDPADRNALWNDDYFRDHRPKSVLCIPILHQGVLRGLIYLENRLLAGAFTSSRLDAMRVVASQAAISLDNADLYRQLEQRVEQRTVELRETQARLLRLERESVEVQMAGGFAHEMRNALYGATLLLEQAIGTEGADASPAMLARLQTSNDPLRRHGSSEVRTPAEDSAQMLMEIDTTLQQVRSSTRRALRITQQILDYARLGSLPHEDEQVSLAQTVDRVLAQLQETLGKNGVAMDVDVPQDVRVSMKADYLQSVVQNLLANAADAVSSNARDAPPRIQLTLQRTDTWVELWVRDNGSGIPSSVQGRLFQPFVSSKGSRGTGLGLAMSRKLVELYGGMIELHDSGVQGTCFVVKLLVTPRQV